MMFIVFDRLVVGIIKDEYGERFRIWKSPVIKNKINIDFFGYGFDVRLLPKCYIKELRIKISQHSSKSVEGKER